jgi:hypothetical protein
MPVRNAVLFLLVSIPAILLLCACFGSNEPVFNCVCTDGAGNKSIRIQNGPCSSQPTGSDLTCTAMDAVTASDGGSGGRGGAAKKGGVDRGH